MLTILSNWICLIFKFKYCWLSFWFIDEAYDERYGARPRRRYITKNIESLLAHKLIDSDIAIGSTLVVDLENNEFVVKIK